MASNLFFYSTPYARYLDNPKTSESSSDIPTKDSDDEKSLVNLRKIYSNKAALARSISLYSARLHIIKFTTDFQRLNVSQRQALQDELLNTESLLKDECQLHVFEGNTRKLKEGVKDIKLCAELLEKLHPNPLSPEQVHVQALADFASEIHKKTQQFSLSESLDDFRKLLSDINFYRLNWVWGGGIDGTVLDALPPNFLHTQSAQDVLMHLSSVTGFMSFILYDVRLSIHLYLLAYHALKGSSLDPWQTKIEEMANISVYERLQAQWKLRQYDIFNDFFWSSANMACFLWLIQEGVFGCTAYMGNILTMVLLLMDLRLTYCRYQADKADYKESEVQYTKDIDAIKDKIASHSLTMDEKAVLKEHLEILMEAQKNCSLEWTYKEKQYQCELLYCMGLIAAFSIMCCLFFPPAGILPASVLLFAIVGSALSCLLTILYHALETTIKIEHCGALQTEAHKKIKELNDNLEKETDSDQKNIMSLKINQQLKEEQFQGRMIRFHQTARMTQVISETLLPASVLACLVLLPVSAALPILIPIIALLLLSSTIVERYNPKHEMLALQS